MLASSIPSRIQLPFANSGTKNTIPVASQIGITPGAASYTDGFPPLTMTPIASGGVPPYGADFNGVLNAITAVQQWQSAGGVFKYDSTFATAIGGYPAGSVLESTDGVTQWISLIDNNSADPDGATPTDWAALASYGVTAVTGLTNTNVTLTSLQYAKKRIVLTGTLTGNVQIIFPTLLSEWLVINNTTGAFTVTCKTAAGTGAVVETGGYLQLYGDGTNLLAPFLTSTSIAFASSLASVGYQKLPSGLIIQWGTGFTTDSNGNAVITLPVAFPTQNMVAYVTPAMASSGASCNMGISSLGLTSIGINSRISDTGAAFPGSGGYWLAIGN